MQRSLIYPDTAAKPTAWRKTATHDDDCIEPDEFKTCSKPERWQF